MDGPAPGRPAPAACEHARLQAPFPVDVARTLLAFRFGASDPTFARQGPVVWRALPTGDGPATVRVVPTAPDRVEATAWGPGAARALERLPAMLGFDDHDDGFVAHHEVVRRTHRRHRGARFGRGGALVETAVGTVLGQKVTTDEANRSWAALVHRHGDRAPGPLPLRLPPRPDRLADLPYHAWHPLGVERRRADTVRRLCARAERLRALEDVDPAEARRVLEHLPGVGPWTSNAVTLHSHGDADAVIVGDYHLPHLVAFALTGRRRGTDEEMLRLLEPYRGQRARALRMVVLSGHRPARRAPRAPRRSFARW